MVNVLFIRKLDWSSVMLDWFVMKLDRSIMKLDISFVDRPRTDCRCRSMIDLILIVNEYFLFIQLSFSECRSLIDLILVVDGSDSISFTDYDKLRYAISHIIPELTLGPRRIRLGIIVYSTRIAQVKWPSPLLLCVRIVITVFDLITALCT